MKRVDAWKTTDGLTWPTKDEAAEHELDLKRERLLTKVLETAGYSNQASMTTDELVGELLELRDELLKALR